MQHNKKWNQTLEWAYWKVFFARKQGKNPWQENSALKSISLTCSQLLHYEWRGGKARLGEQEVHITFLVLLFFFFLKKITEQGKSLIERNIRFIDVLFKYRNWIKRGWIATDHTVIGRSHQIGIRGCQFQNYCSWSPCYLSNKWYLGAFPNRINMFSV